MVFPVLAYFGMQTQRHRRGGGSVGRDAAGPGDPRLCRDVHDAARRRRVSGVPSSQTTPGRADCRARNSSRSSRPTPLLVAGALLVLFPIYWMVITSLKLPREIYRMPSLWPQVFTHQQLPHPDRGQGLPRSNIRNSFIVASSVTIDLGHDLLPRRLFDGALPLPLSRAHRPADPVRLSHADLAALHPALDPDGAAAARQLAARV